jgi:hypothetical protein
LSHKGFVHVTEGGTRIAFFDFEDELEHEIVRGSAPLKVLGLVGDPGQRLLYYSREEPLNNTPSRLAGLPPYKRFSFFRYDFFSGTTEEIRFNRTVN